MLKFKNMQLKLLPHWLKKSISFLIPLSLMLILIFTKSSCRDNNTSNKKSPLEPDSSQFHSGLDSIISRPNGDFKATKTQSAMTIDGLDNELIWADVKWYDMNYIWMGMSVDSTDFHGKFKLAWDSQHLYI